MESRFGIRADCQEQVNAAWLLVVDFIAGALDG
jgi:hypothetical protein